MLDPSTIAAHGSEFRTVEKVRTLETDPMTAWGDWASGDAISRWWGPAATNVDLRVGGPFEILFTLDAPEGSRGSEGCRYLSYLPGEMLSFTWNAPPHLALRATNTWVVLTVSPSPDGTSTLRLVHCGFLDGGDWDDYREYFDRAWDHVLDLHQAHHASN